MFPSLAQAGDATEGISEKKKTANSYCSSLGRTFARVNQPQSHVQELRPELCTSSNDPNLKISSTAGLRKYMAVSGSKNNPRQF